MPERKVSTRSALTVAGAAVAAVLAALLALAVNIGILRAAGSPPGPGRLDRTSVERPVGRLAPAPEPSRRAPVDRPGAGATSTPSDVGTSPERERRFGSGADD